MNITIAQPELSRAVKAAAGAVGSRSTLPIMSHLLLTPDMDKRQLRVTGSDLEVWVERTVTLAEQEELSFGDAPASATVPAASFSAIVSGLRSSAPIHLTREEPSNKLSIVAGGVKSHLLGLAPDDYPGAPDVAEAAGPSGCFTMTGRDFARMVGFTKVAVAKDGSRPVLCPVHVRINDDNTVTMVSTDTHRLHSITLPCETSTAIRSNVPVRGLGLAVDMVGAEESIHVHLTESIARFEATNATMVTRLVEGQYPNWERLIRPSFPIHATFEREAMIAAVRRAMVAASGDCSRVEMHFIGYMVTVSGKSSAVGEVSDEVQIASEGGHIEIAFNGNYMIDALNAITSEGVTLMMSEPLQPAILRPVEEAREHRSAPTAGSLCLMMPMQIVR